MSVHRSTRAVLDDHLALRQEDRLEDDLRRNYATDVVAVSLTGTRRGHEGVREMAAELRAAVPAGSYRYQHLLVEGRVGMLVWSADGPNASITDGSDSFIVEDGRITVQTVHYHVDERGARG